MNIFTEFINLSMVKISKKYTPKETEKYMCTKHLAYFKQKLTDWAGDFGITSDSIKNLTISALIGQMISESKDSGKTSILKQALEMAANFGIADNPANSVINLPNSEN